MKYRRLPIEIESPEEQGYGNIQCNLTESSVRDRPFEVFDFHLKDKLVSYTDHKGHPGMRELLANEAQLSIDNIILTVGAASALYMIHTALLDNSTKSLILAPNYATNRETPRALKSQVVWHELHFENGFKLNLDKLKSELTPDIKLLSLTYPHNPTGSMITKNQLEQIIELVEKNGSLLLMDETYREMCFGETLPIASSLSPNVISVSSLSKSFGLPGLRIGWISCQNKDILELLLAAKEQIFICGSILDEQLAFQFYQNKDQHFKIIKGEIQTNFNILKDWMSSTPYFEWVEPQGGCIAFPRIKDKNIDLKMFYQNLNQELGTFVGPGHWFEMDPRYMRIGYAYPTSDELILGLKNLNRAIENL